jgi:hypothetical protein
MGIPLNYCLPDLNLLGALGGLAVEPAQNHSRQSRTTEIGLAHETG